MEKQIINGEIVTTTKEDLASYLEFKKQELQMIGQDINGLQQRQTSILSELESLIQ